MVILTTTMNHLSHVNINASIFDLCVNDCLKIFNLSRYTMFFKNIIEKKKMKPLKIFVGLVIK